MGVHVTREPRIRENNIVYALEHFKPDFPVVNTAWVGPMPVSHLPWVAVFDHEGERIYAGYLDGLAQIVENALERAPHHIVGGPYEKLEALAKEIAADPANLGKKAAALRKRIASGRDEAAVLAEASALLDAIESYGYGRAEKIIEEIANPAEAAPALKSLGAVFDGDVLGELFSLIADSFESAPEFKDEKAALSALSKARALFRTLPPAGTYAYNLDYTPITDEKILAKRQQVIDRYRASLEKIVKKYRETCAALTASDLLAEVSPRSQDTTGHEIDSDLAEAAEKIMNEFLEAGSGLSLEGAKELGTRLREIAREVKESSSLARRLDSFMREVVWSFEGPAMPDFLPDAAHEGPGIAIRVVFDYGCAQQAGLEAGDVIIGGDGERLVDFRSFYGALANCKPGQRVELYVQRRDGDKPGKVEFIFGRRLR